MNTLNDLKRKVAGTYVKALECVDPKFAEHVLNAQGELFSAAKSFFEAEEGHARKAAARVRQRADEKSHAGESA